MRLKLWKMKPISPIADARAVGEGQACHLLAVEQVTARRRGVEQPENGQQRAFSAPARSGDRKVFAALHFEVNARQRVRFHLIGEEDLLDGFELDQGGR